MKKTAMSRKRKRKSMPRHPLLGSDIVGFLSLSQQKNIRGHLGLMLLAVTDQAERHQYPPPTLLPSRTRQRLCLGPWRHMRNVQRRNQPQEAEDSELYAQTVKIDCCKQDVAPPIRPPWLECCSGFRLSVDVDSNLHPLWRKIELLPMRV